MKRITIPIYGGLLLIASDSTTFDAEHRKLVKKAGFAVDEAIAYASPGGNTADIVIDDGLHIISGIWVKDLGCVCHEAVHCAQMVARHIGMDAVVESEAFAYLTQWFFDQLRSTK